MSIPAGQVTEHTEENEGVKTLLKAILKKELAVVYDVKGVLEDVDMKL